MCALLYMLALEIGLALRVPEQGFAALWPANAVLLAVLMLTRARRWWLYVLAVIPAHFIAYAGNDLDAFRLAWQTAHDCALSIAGAAFLRARLTSRHPFATTRELTVYLLAVVLAMPAIAALGAPGALLGAIGPSPDDASFWTTWRFTYLADAVNFVALVPALVLWGGQGRQWLAGGTRARCLEGGSIAALTVVASVVAFGGARSSLAALGALLLPMLWASARFGAAGAASVHFVTALLATTLVVRGSGGPAMEDVFDLQMFLVTLAGPTLILAALMEERAAAAAESRKDAHALRATQRSLAERHAQLDEAYRRLAHAGRLLMAGELTASIAHEINQPLSAILNNAQAGLKLLETDLAPATVREILEDIRRDDLRASEVITRLRSWLQDRQLASELLDFNEVVRDVVGLLQPEAMRRGVRIESRLGGIPAVRGDRVHLQQVLLNLLVNGMDAMAATPGPERRLTVRTASSGNGSIETRVIDAGCGIPPERLPVLFDSFYTTKEDGMGLGLSIVRSIVAAHGGRIHAANNVEGRGATFKLELPAVLGRGVEADPTRSRAP